MQQRSLIRKFREFGFDREILNLLFVLLDKINLIL